MISVVQKVNEKIETSPRKRKAAKGDRTNIDFGRLHGMLKRQAKHGNVWFYLMVRLLHKQAQLVDGIQVNLVSKKA